MYCKDQFVVVLTNAVTFLLLYYIPSSFVIYFSGTSCPLLEGPEGAKSWVRGKSKYPAAGKQFQKSSLKTRFLCPAANMKIWEGKL